MKAHALAMSAALLCALTACSNQPVSAPGTQVTAGANKLQQLRGDAALEPAYVRVNLVDMDHAKAGQRHVQALPTTWASARVRLHSTDAVSKLTQDRDLIIDRATQFTGNATSSAAFANLRPGNYIFQVTLYTAAGGNGTSAAVHTVDLALAGGSSTAITVTMKTTDGTGANGGTMLNATVDDTAASLVKSNGTNYNSMLGAAAGVPVLVAGDILLMNPTLADSTGAGASSVTAGGSTAANNAALSAGVLSRVVLSYAPISVSATGATLDPAEIFLTDWVRSGNEPIRGATWAGLGDSGDGGTWPARGAALRSGVGAFGNTFTWNTTGGAGGTFPAAYPNESTLAANYQLVFRYYDNTYQHNLIKVQTRPLAAVQGASVGLTVQ
ncbi:MAG: hypothetical protein JWM80_6179 [Cyanobacteria bacterium RYN_339]|nr:hypothetical protein [Cyanobacteria bacterium RYN_339]